MWLRLSIFSSSVSFAASYLFISLGLCAQAIHLHAVWFAQCSWEHCSFWEVGSWWWGWGLDFAPGSEMLTCFDFHGRSWSRALDRHWYLPRLLANRNSRQSHTPKSQPGLTPYKPIPQVFRLFFFLIFLVIVYYLG